MQGAGMKLCILRLGLRIRVSGFGFRVEDEGVRVCGQGLMICGVGCRFVPVCSTPRDISGRAV